MHPSTTGRRKNVLVTIAFIVFGGPGILGIYLPAWITSWRMPEHSVLREVFGFALVALGLLPLFESIVRFVEEGRGTLSPSHPTQVLVARGLYKHIRNPMYVGVLLIVSGQAILFQSWPLWVYCGIVALGFHLFVVLYEEPTLGARYGQQYQEYCRQVPRWIPRRPAAEVDIRILFLAASIGLLMTAPADAQEDWHSGQGEVCFVRPENEGKMNIVESWIRISTYNLPLIGGQAICIFLDPGSTDLRISSEEPYAEPGAEGNPDACISATVKVGVTRGTRRAFAIYPKNRGPAYICGWRLEGWTPRVTHDLVKR